MLNKIILAGKDSSTCLHFNGSDIKWFSNVWNNGTDIFNKRSGSANTLWAFLVYLVNINLETINPEHIFWIMYAIEKPALVINSKFWNDNWI